jgi:hypothetical protein
MVEQTLSPWNRQRFIRVADGENVAPLAVLASAADEPDYGHDINLFSDNPGEVGALYGFGPQPFGDARFSTARRRRSTWASSMKARWCMPLPDFFSAVGRTGAPISTWAWRVWRSPLAILTGAIGSWVGACTTCRT